MLEVFEFYVDDDGMITPLFVESRLEDIKTHNVLEILGSCTSLIAIGEVADYFNCRADVEYEWKFTKSDYVRNSILLAIIHENIDGRDVLWH